ncbi:hypothetical protein [Rossellomorea marisflavi]|uniref:hypothetical protein n=1 Tax=Rossellomorea marisflavi TaxID=189381 RepID=UPI00345AEE84
MKLSKFTKGMAALVITTTLFSGSGLLEKPAEAKADKEVSAIASIEFSGKNSKFVNENKVDIAKHMDDLGVNKSKQKSLLQKMANGEQLDADNPEKVEAIQDELTLDSINTSKSYEFEDGSIIEVSIGDPSGDPAVTKEDKSLQAQSVDDGPQKAVSCGSGYCNYTNVNISATTSSYKATATASWSIIQGKYNADKVNNIKDLYVTMYGGTFSDKKYAIPKPIEDVYNEVDAYGYAQFTATQYGNFINATKRLRLYVGRDKYSVTSF